MAKHPSMPCPVVYGLEDYWGWSLASSPGARHQAFFFFFHEEGEMRSWYKLSVHAPVL